MRNWRSRFCVIGFYFVHGKKKGHWRKREGLSLEWIGGNVQSDIMKQGDSKKREMSIQCSFCCLDTINA